MDVSSVVGVVGWFVQVTFDKFLSSQLQSWAARSGLHHDISNLKLQFRTVKALLAAMRTRATDNHALLELLSELKDAAYDSEDLLDELEYYRVQESVEGPCQGCSSSASASASALEHVAAVANHTGDFLSYQVGRAIDSLAGSLVPRPGHQVEILPSSLKIDRAEITTRIKDVVQNLSRISNSIKEVLSLENLVSVPDKPPPATSPRQTSSFLSAPKVFGRAHEREHVVCLLTELGELHDGTVSVLPVIGYGGVGKTTLAQLVYNDPRVVEHFELRMWLCVSDGLDEVRLTREMLEHACFDRYDHVKNLNRLQEILRAKLMSKRFLLVLDDVWDDSEKRKWETFCAPFRCGPMKGGKILATTRMASVAKLLGTINPIYLDGLRDEEFWLFFKACAFGDEKHKGHPKLQIVGKEIAKKLKGCPLAARSVGGLLKDSLDEEHWARVLESDVWKYQKGENDTMPVLMLSYQHLPEYLQCCFAMCSLFPKGYWFNEENLIFTWMAHGLIQPQNDERRLEDIGRDYLNGLLGRSFLQIVSYGSSTCYVMHDLLHDLAQYISADDCFLLDGCEPRKTVPRTVCHLSIITAYSYSFNRKEKEFNSFNRVHHIYHNENVIQASFNKVKEINKLRSLMLIGGCLSGANHPFEIMFQGLEGIRVLDLSCTFCPMQKLSYATKSFVHLRYLDLHGNEITTLPEFFCKLYNLQILNVKDNPIANLPNGMNNLINLRHLIADSSFTSKIAGIGKLICLQELEKFCVKRENGYEIRQLKNMREIGGSITISNLENVESMEEATEAQLDDKRRISKLCFSWDDGLISNTDLEAEVLESLKPHSNLLHLDIAGYKGARSPRWLAENLIITNLESLHLTDCLAWETLPPLGQLPFLKVLHIIGMDAVAQIGSAFYGSGEFMGFPSLEELRFERMPEWHEWVGIEENHLFPCLRELIIWGCPKLKRLPTFSWLKEDKRLLLFPCLQKLEIMDCRSLMELPSLPHTPTLSEITLKRVGLFSYFILSSWISFSLLSSSSNSLSSTSSLSSSSSSGLCLHILSCPSVRFLNEGFLQFCNLRCLVKLIISSFDELISLGTEGLAELVCLKELNIRNCPKLLMSMTQQGQDSAVVLPSSLERLILFSCGVADKPLSKCLQNLTSLISLSLSKCSHLTILELWSLKSLEDLVIEGCETLTTLEGLQALICLRKLTIRASKFISLNVLQALKGLTEFQHLEIDNCQQLASSEGLQSLTHLKIFEFRDCKKLMSLDGLQALICLKQLHVWRCSKLASLVLYPLTVLEVLTINDCQDLMALEGLSTLIHLKELSVSLCPKVAAGWYLTPNASDRKEQGLSSLKKFYVDETSLLTLPLLESLDSLQFLTIGSQHQPNPLVTSFSEEQEEGLQHLTSLQVLNFFNCPNLLSLPAELHRLSSLKALHIEQCPAILSLPDKGLPASVTTLSIHRCSEELSAKRLKENGEWHKIVHILDRRLASLKGT